MTKQTVANFEWNWTWFKRYVKRLMSLRKPPSSGRLNGITLECEKGHSKGAAWCGGKLAKLANTDNRGSWHRIGMDLTEW